MDTISKNGIITLNRGDTFCFPFCINLGTLINPNIYKLGEHPNGTLYLGVMEPNQSWENALIKQVYKGGDLYIDGEYNSDKYNEDGDVLINFKNTDTMFLYPGKYYYQIILYDPEEVGQKTLVSQRIFYIC